MAHTDARPTSSGRWLFPLLAALLFIPLAACPSAPPAPDGPAPAPQAPIEVLGAGPLEGFPPTVGDFRRTRVLTYPPRRLDYSVGYNLVDPGRPAATTVYVYPFAAQFPEPEQDFEQHFKDTIATIVSYHPEAELLLDAPAQIRQDGVAAEGRRAVLRYYESFAGRHRLLASELYLFRRGAYFVKFRHSYPVAVQETIQADLIELMETLDWADADKAWKTLQNWSF